MMKRLVLVVVSFFVISISLFADAVYSGSSTSGSASMTINLDSSYILSENTVVYCGFTLNGESGGDIIPLSSDLVLTKSYATTTTFFASGTAYVFLRIASSQKLSFTLSWDKLINKNPEVYLYISKNGASISTDSPIYLFEPELDSIIDERIELKFSTGSSAISTSKKLTSIVKLTVKAES